MMPWTDLVYAQEFPFTPGPYGHKQLRLTWSKNRCPLDSTVYYPSMSGDYTPIVFLGGFYDVISGEGYSDFLGKITSHGYMLITVDLLPTLHFQPESELSQLAKPGILSRFYDQIEWLKKNLGNMTIATPDWEKLTLSCHSASCVSILSVIHDRPSYAAGAIFLDPVCLFSSKMKPVQICKHICAPGSPTGRNEYKDFTAGMIHSFLRVTLYRDRSYRKYISNETLMPFALNDLAYDFSPIDQM
ncbi:chlorophyllase-1-like isoform x2 [Plakobranchus ocellatus]|uniref:Chlorophyllase-1-like isoform x2 n=1 Tax=Plakobranchus ocellatus TaxID=259542 RepID=A0AAV4D9G0_9GAST|nr:chlorophyllase-1-like isoform x2 [Plakobranchus ocellatus]